MHFKAFSDKSKTKSSELQIWKLVSVQYPKISSTSLAATALGIVVRWDSYSEELYIRISSLKKLFNFLQNFKNLNEFYQKKTDFDKTFDIKKFFETLLIKKVKLFQFRYIDLNSEDTRIEEWRSKST